MKNKYFACWGLVSGCLLGIVPNAMAVETPVIEVAQSSKQIGLFLTEGKKLYQAGKFAAAASIWQQAARESASQDDLLQQALSLSYLASAYQELGKWELAQSAITRSLNILATIPGRSPLILAQVLNTQGSLQLAKGETAAALETWQQAESNYSQAGDKRGVLGSRINQAQALQSLGLYRRAQLTLQQINQKLQQQPDSLLKATGLHSLGIAFQVTGKLTQSQQLLQQSLAIAEELNLNSQISSIFFSLGNTASSLGEKETARQYYQQAAATATNTLSQIQAEVNQLRLLVATQQWQQVQLLLPQIEAKLSQLTPSRAGIYAQVNLAESLIQLSKNNQKSGIKSKTARILAQAVKQAQILPDRRAESYALGTLGKLYEQQSQWQAAQKLTQTALEIAQSINAGDIAYQWQWQLGRILKAQGDREGAIAAETEAVNTLEKLRNDLVAVNPDVQFSFRESVEPVYRELVDLLLQPNQGGEIDQVNLQQARQLVESLQLAELDNFFRESCLDAKPQNIDEIDANAAVIYPIILPERLAIIISIPGQPLIFYQTQLSEAEINNTLENLLQSLNPAFDDKLRLQFSQQVYNWLIRPGAKIFADNGIETLVFVLDGLLRNLPMAAIHDGETYLIEKYRVALTPGLQLLASESLAQQKLKALTAGVSEARQGFVALPGVEVELQEINSQLPAIKLLNEEFTLNKLEKELRQTSFPILHLATHGQFSSNPDNTFVITWDSKLTIDDFQQLLSERATITNTPIELLILSACQTAAGDRRAALGLAGIAVRSGARSTIATLWSVKDESTVRLMTQLYEQLQKNKDSMTKAEALRQAQLNLINSPDFQHPFYWSPFVLVGNWL